MNQDEFYQRVREIACIEADISRLQDRLHTLYVEMAHQTINAIRGSGEANPDQERQAVASA